MLKRIVMLIVLGLIFSSCDFIHYGKIAIQDNMYRVERAREIKEARKKDAYAAAGNPEYEAGVELAIKDISKRSVNKRVEFGEITLLIPENTRINSKHGNIVDEKTGYGIAITFTLSPHCMSKKVNGKEYSLFYNSKHNANVAEIAKEIIKVNGFEDTCK